MQASALNKPIMSGAEAALVVSLIAAIIAIVDKSQQLLEAAKDAHGLPEVFRHTAESLPIVNGILHKVKELQDQAVKHLAQSHDPSAQQAIEQTSKNVNPILTICEENAQALHDIFKKVLPGDDASRLQRYRKAVRTVLPGRKRKVEELMKEIMQKLQLLHEHHYFESAVDAAQLQVVIEQMSKLPPSLEEDENPQYTHSGSGSINVNPGSGVQRNYNHSGGSGKQFNADKMIFGGGGSDSD